jgi:hypothetical protein
MVFRSLLSALTVGILLTQSAAMLGQVHAGLHLNGHDPRPHVHIGVVCCGHDHPQPEIDEDIEEASAPQPHDDTFHISLTDSLASASGFRVSSIDFPGFPGVPSVLALEPNPRGRVSHPPIPCHPPDHPCPLYVRHRTLLI